MIDRKQYFYMLLLLTICLIIQIIIDPSKFNTLSTQVLLFSDIILTLFAAVNAYMDKIIPSFNERFRFQYSIFNPVYLSILALIIFINIVVYIHK